MDELRLQELASRIEGILKEYEIEDKGFQLKIFVNQHYYDQIKDGFSKRNPLDIVVGSRGEDWTIDIMYLRSLIDTSE